MAIKRVPQPKRAIKTKYPFWLCISIFITLAATVLALLSLCVLNQWTLDLHLNGEEAVVLEYGQNYQEQGAEARFHGTRFFREGWPVAVQMGEEKVDDSVLGDYTLTYQARKLLWSAKVQRTVTIQDTTPPEINLISREGAYTLPGGEYEEEGYTATDNHDGDLTAQVVCSEKDGVVTYSVTDSSGNRSKVKRSIVYKDPDAPLLTLLGDSTVTLTAGDDYTEPGWTASDNVDGDLSDLVKVSGTVDTYTAGTYTLKYSVTDDAGNKAKANRTIVVEPIRQPDSVTPTGKVIYLTFDDGPGPYTRRLLDVLAKYNVKATFFTCNTGYTSLIKDEYEEGHSIAIHSATHDYKTIYSSKKAYFKDLEKQSDIIYDKTDGYRTTLIRFPGGGSNTVSRKYCKGIMTELSQSVTDQGYQYFDWNVNSGDADSAKTSKEVYRNVTNGIKAKEPEAAVVLQHDIHEFSVNAVERIIVWGLNNGYTFLPLDSTSPTAHQTIAN